MERRLYLNMRNIGADKEGAAQRQKKALAAQAEAHPGTIGDLIKEKLGGKLEALKKEDEEPAAEEDADAGEPQETDAGEPQETDAGEPDEAPADESPEDEPPEDEQP